MFKKTNNKTILAIDPGLNDLGYAVLRIPAIVISQIGPS